MRPPRFWSQPHHPLKYALWPAGFLFTQIGRTRRCCVTAQKMTCPVICVGNITLGGGGKTPIVRWLAKELKAMGAQPAILSRGYGGSQKTPLRVDADKHSAALVGDEPLMLAQNTDMLVFVGRDKAATAKLAMTQGAEVLLLDDGLQNPSLHYDCALLVVDKSIGLGNGAVFPAGPLRERPRNALARIDGLVLTGTQPPTPRKDIEKLSQTVQKKSLPVIDTKTILSHAGDLPKHAIAFCGIAYPQKFFAMLETHGMQIKARFAFGDHQPYSEKAAAKILAKAKALNLPLVTTCKDMARLADQPKGSARARLFNTSTGLDVKITPIDTPDALHALLKKTLNKKSGKKK